MIEIQRSKLLQKSDNAMLTSKYLSEFNTENKDSLYTGMAMLENVKEGFWHNNTWVFILQAIIASLIALYFRSLKSESLERIGLERTGAPGTTAALALLNDQVKKGGVMASSYVGGLSGAFIPVSEDQGMIDAVNAGALTIEKLEAMTCVCSVGLDMIAIPGDTKPTTIAGIIADESAIGMVNQKTTAVRIIPVIGKGVGENVEFGGLLGHAPIMPVNNFDCSVFVNRGGRIPAPIHSFKN